MKKTIINLAYRIKNSNVVLTFRANPFFWTYRVSVKKVLSYVDDWLYEPNLHQYRVTFLFLAIDLFVDMNSYYKNFSDSDEFRYY